MRTLDAVTADRPAEFTESERRNCLTNRVLQLIVMPTEQCVFRCSYCFERFEHGRMETGTVEGIKKLLDRRAAELAWVAVDWYGGEPLLAADIVDDIQRHAQSLAARHPALHLRSSMTTNGYLLDHGRMSTLLSSGVDRFQIAIDGPPRIHDRRRLLANGDGTFDRIWANLLSARRQSRTFEITIRVQLDRETANALDEFLELYATAFADDPRFVLAFFPLRCTNGQGTSVVEYLDTAESESVPLEAQTRAAQMNLAFREPPASIACHAARGNSFVVRSNGDLSKCVVALSDPSNRVGRLKEDGRVEIDDLKINPWLRGLWSENAAELGCPLVGLPRVGE